MHRNSHRHNLDKYEQLCYKAKPLRKDLWSDLHDGDGSVGDGSPVDGAHHDAGGGEGAGLRDEPVGQVQHVNHGT